MKLELLAIAITAFFILNTYYDGKYVKAPKNVIYEVKFPLIDVKGTIS